MKNGGKLSFAVATTAVVTTGTAGSSGNSDHIENATNENVTLVSESSGHKLVYIKGTNSDGSIVPSGTENDVTISKDTAVESAPAA